jgi:choline dehydrogenase-like flavoprotein
MLRFSDCELKAGTRDNLGPDWPLSYAELKESYDHVEEFSRVCGSVEGLRQLPDGPYVETHSLTAAEMELKRRVEARWSDRHVIPVRIVRSRLFPEERSGWPQFSSRGSTLAVALESGHCVLRDNVVVRRVIMDPERNQASGLDCIDTASGQSFTIETRAIVLCASALETTRILLNSATSDHPDGLCNSSGVLGRFLTDHWCVYVHGTVRNAELNTNPLGRGVQTGFHIPRFVDIDSVPEGFRRGFGIHGGAQRPISSRNVNLRGKVPFFLTAVGETLPYATNRVFIDPTRVDARGIPVLRIEFSYRENELAMTRCAQAALEEIADLVRSSTK